MKTIKEVLQNQESISKRIEQLLMDGKADEVMQFISDMGYQIRTENQAPLDEKQGYDNEAHELAIFLNDMVEKLEQDVDITEPEMGQIILAAKKSVKEITKDVMGTAKIRQSLSHYDAQKYKESMQKGIEDAKKELERTQADHDFMSGIDAEIFGTPQLNIDIINKDNQINELNEISKKLEQIKKLQDNMAKLDPDDPEDAKMIDNHKIKIQNLMSGKLGIEASLDKLVSAGLDVTTLRELIKNEPVDSTKTKREIESQKKSLDKAVTADYDAIMKNLKVVAKKYSAYKPFANIDFSKMDPNTKEGREAIEKGYGPFKRIFIDIERRRHNAQNNIDNFSKEIETLDKERAILDKDTTDRDAYVDGMDDATKSLIESKKAEKHQDNIDKVYGNKEKAELYKEKFLKFKSHIKDAELSYVDRDGVRRTVQGKTLESYEGMESDLDFLQLESYKSRLERTSMFAATRDWYAYDPVLAKKMETGTPEEMREAAKQIEEQLRRDKEYVATYHGAHNSTKMQHEAYLNAGTALKAMVPLKNADTLPGKVKIGAQNVGKYLGFKVPKFSRIDENGNKVRDIPSGIAAIAGDAIIGGGLVVATALGGPLGIPAVYGAKTVAVLGMRGYGKHYGKKHKDEMDIPTPYDGKGSARRIARQDAYLRQGHSRVGSIARSWLDYARKGHRESIENQIIEDRNREIDKSIDDQYILGAMLSDEKKKREVQQNYKIRSDIHDEIERSGAVYNDTYGDVDSARTRTIDQRVNEAVALGMAGEDINDRDRIQFTDSKLPRSTNFAKAKISPSKKVKDAIETGTQYGERFGETVWTNSITNQEIKTGITSTTDMKRRVATVLVGLGLKGLGKLINPTKTQEIEFEDERGTGEYENVQVGSHKERDIIGYNTKPSTRDATLDDITVGDLQREGNASWGAFNNDSFQYASGYHPDVSFTSSDTTIQGLAIQFEDISTGKTVSYSISGNDIAEIVHNNPALNEFTSSYASGDLGISPDTKLSDLAEFIQDDSVRQAYQNYLNQYSGSEQIDKLLDTVEFAWGRSESVIGRGWTPSVLSDDDLRSVITEVIDKNDPIYGEWYDVPDMELREIMEPFINTREEDITDPVLLAIKKGLDSALLGVSSQQLGEAVGEAAKPTPETEVLPKLDKAKDNQHVRRPYSYRFGQDSNDRGDDEGR